MLNAVASSSVAFAFNWSWIELDTPFKKPNSVSEILVFAPILVALILFTFNVIFPDDVIGVLPIVNSDPDCVIPTDSTVPELLGVTCV